MNALDNVTGRNTFHTAILNRSNVIAQKLIKHYGADVNALTSEGETPLHLALSMHGDTITIISMLINNGANPNIFNGIGETPLHLAVRNLPASPDNFENILAKCESDEVNTPTKREGDTAIHLLARHVNSGFIFRLALDLLIAKGADLNALNKNNETALTLLRSRSDIDKSTLAEMIYILSEKVSQDAERISEQSLHDAVVSGDIETVRKAIQQNLDMVKKSINAIGEGLLHVAVTKEHPEIVELLVYNAGVDVNAKTKTGDTPLHYAVRRENFDVTVALGKYADPNARNNRWESPFNIAISRKNNRIIDHLYQLSGVPTPGQYTGFQFY